MADDDWWGDSTQNSVATSTGDDDRQSSSVRGGSQSDGWRKHRYRTREENRSYQKSSYRRRRSPLSLSTSDFRNRKRHRNDRDYREGTSLSPERRESPLKKKKEFVSSGTDAPHWGPGIDGVWKNINFQNKYGLNIDKVFTVLTDFPSNALSKPYPVIFDVDPKEADLELVAEGKRMRNVVLIPNSTVLAPATRKISRKWPSMCVSFENDFKGSDTNEDEEGIDMTPADAIQTESGTRMEDDSQIMEMVIDQTSPVTKTSMEPIVHKYVVPADCSENAVMEVDGRCNSQHKIWESPNMKFAYKGKVCFADLL